MVILGVEPRVLGARQIETPGGGYLVKKIICRALLITLVASGGPIGIALLRGTEVAPMLAAIAGCFVIFLGVVLLGRFAVVAFETVGLHRLALALGREVGPSAPSDTSA